MDKHEDEDEEDSQTTARNTLVFLGDWLSLRRQGQDITQTPMGYVCQGWQLRSDHPFFTQRLVDANVLSDGYTFQPGSQSENDVNEDVDSEDDDIVFDEEERKNEDIE